jgi:hypothetical protein
MHRFLPFLFLLGKGFYLLILFGFCLQGVGANSKVSFGGVHLTLSPDGEQIAMSYQGSIAVFDRTDGVLRLLTKGSGCRRANNCFSPDLLTSVLEI